MFVKFNLKTFGQCIPTKVNIPDDELECALEEYEGDLKIAVSQILNDEIEDVVIDDWEQVT